MSLGSKYAGHEMIVPRSTAVVNNVTVMDIYQKVCHESDRALKEENMSKNAEFQRCSSLHPSI